MNTETYAFWSLSGYTSEFALKDALRQFDLKKNYARYGRDEFAQMALRGLSYLLWNTGDCIGTNSQLAKLNYNCSVERIKEAFDEYLAEAREEQKDDFEMDREWAVRRYRCETVEDAEHPWGDEEVAVMNAWLALDPFEWFLFTRSVKEAGVDAIEDNIDEFVVNEAESSSYIHDAVRKASDTLMTRFAERVKKEQQCKSKPQQHSVA